MAPVPFTQPVRYSPFALVTAHLAAVLYLTYAVGDSLYTSYKSLGPVSGTRSRISYRRRYVPVFLALAVAAFAAAAYYFIASATLSYRTWAYEQGLDLTERFSGDASGQLHVARWLSDTAFYRDALEIVAERERRFWWGQQVDLGITAFALMLATEGRRRKIPLVTAFLALAYLVSLSFAQGLFFLALLLTPSPLPSGDDDLVLPVVPLHSSMWTRLRDKVMPPKPSGWVPHSMLFHAAMALNFCFTLMLPFVAGTSAFARVVLLTRASAFLPVLLPKITPVRWGSVQQHQYDSNTLANLFRFLSTTAFGLHAKTTLTALISNAPNSHYHRHSPLFPRDTEVLSRWERSTNPFGKILGSTFDHPVVAAVGWDVVLCTLSLGLWAAVRALNARDMIRSSIPFAEHNLHMPSRTDKGKSQDDQKHPAFNKEEPKNERENTSGHNMTLRRRGRTTRSRGGTTTSGGARSESARPRTRSSRRRQRKRGRSRKAKKKDAEEEDEDAPSPGTSKAEEEDPTYVPSPTVARSAPEGDESPPRALDWESASLAWGLAALCGLASASAGVFGGECISSSQ